MTGTIGRSVALSFHIGSYSGRRRRSRWPPTVLTTSGPAGDFGGDRGRQRAEHHGPDGAPVERDGAAVHRDASLFLENAAARVGL
jgi:hypothetical protein